MASGSHPAHGTEKLFKTSGLNQEKENQRNQRKTLIVKEKKESSEEGGATPVSDSHSKNKQTECKNNGRNSKNKQTRRRSMRMKGSAESHRERGEYIRA